MLGTGPAAQAAAFHAAGVSISRLARELRFTRPQVTLLIFGYWLHAGQAPELEVGDERTCLISGCRSPRTRHGVCAAHLARFYAGAPVAGRGRPPRPLRVSSCVVCGVQWCELTTRRHRICGSPRCRAAVVPRPDLSERNATILARVAAGEKYGAIAADFGISDRRVSQLANRAGLFRTRTRPGSTHDRARAQRRTTEARL